ncbi:hypothetical protein RI543_004353 [Arxiozyma heterogenica]|uniref:Ubiquitin thioesterase OTU n=1 Tax=Arxiozyma heterogenica TaxID=278026 RepID=A0AAN8A6H4_9SACH|nr:hypothetical protein RI543_004353 [Kazachstania heterogenica]
MKLKISEVNEKDRIIKLDNDNCTLQDLLNEVGKDAVETYGYKLSYGYPLKTIVVGDDNINSLLSTLNITNGDKIFLRDAENKKVKQDPISELISFKEKTVSVKKVPDDNSCLFHCLSYSIYGNMNYSTQIRRQISEYIKNHPLEYNDPAILDGKTIEQYCQWIEDYNSWGGYIELSIIPRIYENVTIWICDIINNYIDKITTPTTTEKYENDINSGSIFYQNQIIVLLYNGIHYDLIVGPVDGQYNFRFDDNEWLNKQCYEIMEKYKNRTFDSKRVEIKCKQCGVILVGEKNVSEHAMKTLHYDFAQL